MAKSGFTNYQQQRILSRAFGSVAYTEPATLYIGASTTTINEDGTGATEPSDISYARVAVTNNTSNWGVLLSGTGIRNLTAIEFPTATADWTTITYIGIYDSATSGNILYYSELISPKSVGVDDVLRADIGSIEIRINPTA